MPNKNNNSSFCNTFYNCLLGIEWYRLFQGIVVIKVSQSCRAPTTVSNERSSGQNSAVFSHSPTEGREVGTIVTTDLCMPIILCTLLTYPNVIVE